MLVDQYLQDTLSRKFQLTAHAHKTFSIQNFTLQRQNTKYGYNIFVRFLNIYL